MTALGGMDAYAFEAPGYLLTTIATVHEHLEHPLHPLLADYETVNIPIEYGTDYESLSGDESSDESDASSSDAKRGAGRVSTAGKRTGAGRVNAAGAGRSKAARNDAKARVTVRKKKKKTKKQRA